MKKARQYNHLHNSDFESLSLTKNKNEIRTSHQIFSPFLKTKVMVQGITLWTTYQCAGWVPNTTHHQGIFTKSKDLSSFMCLSVPKRQKYEHIRNYPKKYKYENTCWIAIHISHIHISSQIKHAKQHANKTENLNWCAFSIGKNSTYSRKLSQHLQNYNCNSTTIK